MVAGIPSVMARPCSAIARPDGAHAVMVLVCHSKRLSRIAFTVTTGDAKRRPMLENNPLGRLTSESESDQIVQPAQALFVQGDFQFISELVGIERAACEIAAFHL